MDVLLTIEQTRALLGEIWEILYKLEKGNACATGVVKAWLARQESGLKLNERKQRMGHELVGY